MAFRLDRLVRENIRQLVPYSSARDEFVEEARILLDANENSFGSPIGDGFNRYPDPHQSEIKKRIAEQRSVRASEIFIGNGSDEAIDLLVRIFCRPRVDNIIICPPTYGMYEVAAGINDIAVRRVNLTDDFDLNIEAVMTAAGENTKIAFLCSPNNPTGNCLNRVAVFDLIKTFSGILVVDEAYIHFSGETSLITEINRFENLVVLQTFSKAWGLAGLRVGLAFANERIVGLLDRVKPPYNVSQIAQESILRVLDQRPRMGETVAEIVHQRKVLAERLGRYSFITTVYPSDANFLLVKTTNAGNLYRFLLSERIVVRNRSNLTRCEGCLRVTVGTPDENEQLLNALTKYEEGLVY